MGAGGRRRRRQGESELVFHFKKDKATNNPTGDEAASCKRPFGDSSELSKFSSVASESERASVGKS